MKGFGFKQLKRQEGPSFYLNGFTEKRRREATAPKKQSPAHMVRIIFSNAQVSLYLINLIHVFNHILYRKR